jgi:hypothetical protein
MTMKKGRVLPQVEIDFVHSLPIPSVDDEVRAELVSIARELRTKSTSSVDSKLDVINHLVAKAYALSFDQITVGNRFLDA